MIRGIGHLAFDVADMNKSIDFYCGILGFKRPFRLRMIMATPGSSILRCVKASLSSCFMGLKINLKR